MNYKWFVFIIFLVSACFNSEEASFNQIVDLSGRAEKGPFIAGSDVTIIELNDNLNPTGRIFNSTIINNQGFFEIPEIELRSEFIQINVEGLFYSENLGGTSEQELTIRSLAKVNGTRVTNVNLMTHIEDTRVRKLVAEGMSFENAKIQSFNEFLTVFGVKNDLNKSASNDVSLLLEENSSAFLFAISAVFTNLQKGDPDSFSRWLEFLLRFEEDFGDNGFVDDAKLLERLFFSAKEVLSNANWIKLKLQEQLGSNENEVQIPNFEPYVDTFIESLPELIERLNTDDVFPSIVDGKVNVLSFNGGDVLTSDKEYVIAFNPPDVPFWLSLHVNANYQNEESSFDASDQLWEGQHNHPNGAMYDLGVPSEFINEPVVIPISFSGTGDLIINVNLEIEGAGPSNPIDIEAFWVDAQEPNNAADTIYINNDIPFGEHLNYSEVFERNTYLIFSELDSVYNIGFFRNAFLTGVEFPSLVYVEEGVGFYSNARLNTVKMPLLKEVGRTFDISRNYDLQTLEIDSLQSVDEAFYISNNSVLESVNAPNINSIGDQLFISFNPSLFSLNIGGLSFDDDFSSIARNYLVCHPDDEYPICNSNQ